MSKCNGQVYFIDIKNFDYKTINSPRLSTSLHFYQFVIFESKTNTNNLSEHDFVSRKNGKNPNAKHTMVVYKN